jgi:small subunit ribosomal protein S6
MRPYEAMIILDSSAEESVVDANLARVTDLIKSKKGTVGETQKWGRRRFAYEMNHKWEGNYTVTEFTAEPETVAEIDRLLTLADDVLRHKVVRLPDSFAGGKRPASNPAAPAAETESRN